MPNSEQGRPLAPASPDNLALQLQELFTAIVRLRARRQQVSNAELFRGQVLNSVKTAEQAARASGYTDADIRLAVFAVVAFLDESLLNLRQAVFNDWVRRPLQEEMFGRHVGGEVFFDHLQELLERRDSVEVADVLEVFYLCLLLGYLGRFSISSKGDLQALMQRTNDFRRCGIAAVPRLQAVSRVGSQRHRANLEPGGAITIPWGISVPT